MTELSNLKKPAALVALSLLYLVSVPVSIYLNALVLSSLWLWFLVPLGVPAIGLAHAWGILILKNVFTFRYKYENPEPKISDEEAVTRYTKILAALYTLPLVSYVFGLFASWLMG